MKVIQTNKEVESIEIVGKDGENLSIWLPTDLEVAFEGIELNEDNNNITCEISIHCKALVENVNVIQEALNK